MAELDETAIDLQTLETPEHHGDEHSRPEAANTADDIHDESHRHSAAHKTRAAAVKISWKGASSFLGTLIGISAIFVAIWYGYPSLIIQRKGLDIQKWQANNDFRNQCRALLELANVSSECEQALRQPLLPPPLLRRSLAELKGLNTSHSTTRDDALSGFTLVASILSTTPQLLLRMESTVLMSVTLSSFNIIFSGSILYAIAFIFLGSACGNSICCARAALAAKTKGTLYSQLPFLQSLSSGTPLLSISQATNLFTWAMLNIICAGLGPGPNIVVLLSTFGAGFIFARRFQFRLTRTPYGSGLPEINFASEEEGIAVVGTTASANVSGGSSAVSGIAIGKDNLAFRGIRVKKSIQKH